MKKFLLVGILLTPEWLLWIVVILSTYGSIRKLITDIIEVIK